jgi:flagellar biosynthetic protein FlhB
VPGEKTEKPTAKRLKDSRKEGRVARTPDLGTWGAVLLASFLLPAIGASVADDLQVEMIRVGALIRSPDVGGAIDLLKDALTTAGKASLLFAGCLLVLGLVLTGAQGGIRFAAKPLKPTGSRINPMAGFKRMFGPHAGWESAKSLIKTTVVGLLVWRTVSAAVPLLSGEGTVGLPGVLAAVDGSAISLIRGVAFTGLVLAMPDYLITRRRVSKQLKMSRQDIKDENKQSEGDPQLKGAIRSRQFAMSRMRMMTHVATADVVLVNPTHVAVALRYESRKGAPRVVAKGAGAVAARIREKATEHRVPMVEDIPLARALYKACDVGQEIPPEMFTAIAQVLAFVMSLKARGSAAGLHRAHLLARR